MSPDDFTIRPCKAINQGTTAAWFVYPPVGDLAGVMERKDNGLFQMWRYHNCIVTDVTEKEALARLALVLTDQSNTPARRRHDGAPGTILTIV